MIKWLVIGLGGVSVMGGLVTFWLPLPIGVPLMLLGVTILLRHSPRARTWILRVARSYPGLGRRLERIRPISPDVGSRPED